MSKYRNVTEYLQKFASVLFLWTTVVQPQFFLKNINSFLKTLQILAKEDNKKEWKPVHSVHCLG